MISFVYNPLTLTADLPFKSTEGTGPLPPPANEVHCQISAAAPNRQTKHTLS